MRTCYPAQVAIELRRIERDELEPARRLLVDACEFDDIGPVADEVLFGRAPGALRSRVTAAFSGKTMVGVTASADRWLRVLAVAPTMRERGIGTALLATVESAVIAAGHDTLGVLAQPGNYLAPGVDTRNTDTIAWLLRRDFEQAGRNTNLLIDVRDNPKVSATRAAELAERATAAGYRLERATADHAAELAAAIEREFSPAWAFECERALQSAGLHVARSADGALAAFAAHDGNNAGLGWFGPAGTWPAHRGKGLGAALLMACLVDVAADHAQCTIAWIGPREFYDRVAGIASERHFTVMRKSLTER